MRFRAAPALALLGLAACSDLVSPKAGDTYQFRRIVTKETGGPDTLIFHWKAEDLPLRIYVAAGSPLEAPMATAIARWDRAFLFGELRAVLVDDPAGAHIVVENTPTTEGLVAFRLGAFAPQCTGATDGPSDHTITLPIRINIWSGAGQTGDALATCYRITATHELGHALGIISPNHAGATPGDVMYRDPVLDGLSDRDMETARVLYHTPRTVEPVRP